MKKVQDKIERLKINHDNIYQFTKIEDKYTCNNIINTHNYRDRKWKLELQEGFMNEPLSCKTDNIAFD